jgi:NAD(P)H-hydrate epimerase
MKVITSLQARRLDACAINDYGIPAFVLMDHAGKAVAQEASRLFKRKKGHVIAICGGGNNGGDGIVAARWLKGWGIDAEVWWLRDPKDYKGGVALHASIARRLSIRFKAFDPKARISGKSVIIDALLGTGTKGELREDYRRAIEWVNRMHCPVVAVDIPSGLDADTGRPLGMAVKADVTVTMAVPKKGLVVARARPFVGKLVVADIGIPIEP